MMNDGKKYEMIFMMLSDAGIKQYNDLIDKTLTRGKLLSAQNYPWIADLSSIINSLYYDAEKHIGNIDGQIFLVDEIESRNHQSILKYSCIFPDRMIMSSGEFHYLDKAQYTLIDIDFFRKLFWSKELLLNGIVHISPFYLCSDLVNGEGDINNALIENLSLPDKNKKKIAQLDKIGFGNTECIPYIDKIFVELPWLTNANVQDYLEIINSNKTEFIFYNKYLSNLSDISEDTAEYLQRFARDFSDASVNIQIALEKKQAELKTKGIVAFLSICLTAIPLVFPSSVTIDTKTLSAVLGGGTLKQFTDLLPIHNEKKAIGKDNPFWVLWKWKNA